MSKFFPHDLRCFLATHVGRNDETNLAPLTWGHVMNAVHTAPEMGDEEKFLLSRAGFVLLPQATKYIKKVNRRLSAADFGYTGVFVGGRLLIRRFDFQERPAVEMKVLPAARRHDDTTQFTSLQATQYKYSSRSGSLVRHLCELVPQNGTVAMPLRLKPNTDVEQMGRCANMLRSLLTCIEPFAEGGRWVGRFYEFAARAVSNRRLFSDALDSVMVEVVLPSDEYLQAGQFPLLAPLAEFGGRAPFIHTPPDPIDTEELVMRLHFASFYKWFIRTAAPAGDENPLLGLSPWDELPKSSEAFGPGVKNEYCIPSGVPVIEHALRAYARALYVSEKLHTYFDYDRTVAVTDSIYAPVMIDSCWKDFSSTKASNRASWTVYDSTTASRASAERKPLSSYYGTGYAYPSRATLRTPEDIMNSRKRAGRLVELVRMGLYDYDNLLNQYNSEASTQRRAVSKRGSDD